MSSTNPIDDESIAAAKDLATAPEEWRRWWREHGERELRCVLMTAWDPCGVQNFPRAWDEYDDYINGVAQQLRTSATDDERIRRLAHYLEHIERDFIGVEGSATKREYQASVLVAWYEWSFRRGGRRVGRRALKLMA